MVGIAVLPTFGLFVGLFRIYMMYIKTEVLCGGPLMVKMCELGEKHECCKGEFITLIRAASLTILALIQIPRHQYDRPPD